MRPAISTSCWHMPLARMPRGIWGAHKHGDPQGEAKPPPSRTWGPGSWPACSDMCVPRAHESGLLRPRRGPACAPGSAPSPGASPDPAHRRGLSPGRCYSSAKGPNDSEQGGDSVESPWEARTVTQCASGARRPGLVRVPHLWSWKTGSPEANLPRASVPQHWALDPQTQHSRYPEQVAWPAPP